MSLENDLRLDSSKFRLEAIDPVTASFVAKHRKLEAEAPVIDKLKSTEFISKERECRRARVESNRLPSGKNFRITVGRTASREQREIPVRMFNPKSAKGVFMHMHGGGWVFNTEDSHDEHLNHIAHSCDLIVISVGYRLAPENPHPSGAHDCFDVADYLISKAKIEFGAELVFLGGESAGAHLSLLTFLHLLETGQHSSIRGLSLPFGCYDLSYSPSLRNATQPQQRFADTMKWYLCRLFNSKSPEDDRYSLDIRRDPAISPFYFDLQAVAGQLPAALFMCGTDDPLIDDSVFMAVKWQMAGGKGILKVHPGGWHGYIFHEQKDSPLVATAREQLVTFINKAVEGTI